MNLADWNVEVEEVTILGNTFKVSPARMSDLGKLQRFLNRQPRPKVEPPDLGCVADLVAGSVPLAELPPDKLDAHLVASRRTATDLINSHLVSARADALQWPPEVGLEERAFRLIFTAEDGPFEILFTALSRHQPTLNRADCQRLFDDMSPEELGRVIGVFLASNDGDASPKNPESAAESPPTG